MIQSYARTYHEFWSSSVAELDDTSRALAHFLYSARGLEPFGLYYKPVRYIAHEFRRTDTQVRTALRKLEDVGFAYHDDESGYVWVKEMAAWQLRPLPLKPGNMLIKTVRRWYQTLGRNPYLGPYFDRYERDLWLSDPHVFPGSEVTRRDHQTAAPKVDEPAADPAPAAKIRYAGEADFTRWWQHYPEHRRQARKVALDVWMRKKFRADQVDELIARLDSQKQTRDWRKEHGKYVPMPAKYLRDERYTDAVTGRPAMPDLNPTNQQTIDTLMELHDEFDLEPER